MWVLTLDPVGAFNSQSTANAWWAVSKLHATEHPASAELLQALESALVRTLTAPCELQRPNSQAISSTWWVQGWGGKSEVAAGQPGLTGPAE